MKFQEIGGSLLLTSPQFLVEAASSREKKSLYSDHHIKILTPEVQRK
jgi:hypothetical protein